mgnify:CR=1 FL=1
MYVKDLEEGCLLRCNRQGFVFGLKKITPHAELTVAEAGALELIDLGYAYSATAIRVPDRMGTRRNFYSFHELAIYTGIVKLTNYWFGVKTLHSFIINGIPAIMDGYQIKDLEKIE